MELISTHCNDGFEDKRVVIRVRVGVVDYSFEVPSALWPDLADEMGWPTDNPCTP